MLLYLSLLNFFLTGQAALIQGLTLPAATQLPPSLGSFLSSGNNTLIQGGWSKSLSQLLSGSMWLWLYLMATFCFLATSSLGQERSSGRQLRSQLRPPPSSPCPLRGCLSSLSCNLFLCPARLSLAAELTLVWRKWDWCFVRQCFSLFLSAGIELQRQRALTEDGVSGEMSNAGPDCSAVIKHLREDVPGRGMLTLWSWTDSSSFNYSFHR